MEKVPTAHKLRIVARIASQRVTRSRTYGAVQKGVRATFGHFTAVARQLWLEITGFVFLAFAGVGLVGTVREYLAYHARRATSGHLAAAIAFTLMFAWFGIDSFWRVRKQR